MRLEDPELDALLAPLRDRPVALSGHGEGASRRQRLLPGIQAHVRATPARLRRTRVLRRSALAASACGALLAAFAVVELRDASPTTTAAPTAAPAALRVETLGNEPLTFVDARGRSHLLAGDAPIAGSGELRAPSSSWSRVLTARGARIELAPRARLRVAAGRSGDSRQPSTRPPDAELRLERGEAHLSVPKLAAGSQFSIATPDAQVVVHGTVFSVRVDPEATRRTCVRVNEGLVEVRHRAGSTMLLPGMQWGCDEPAVAQASAPPIPPAAVGVTAAGMDVDEPPAPRHAARSARRARAHAAAQPAEHAIGEAGARGTLAQETTLLAAALAAERDGDAARARDLFSALLSRYPRSPLVPEARSGIARTRP